MNSLPLHPAIVHLPLGLAFVMPLIAFGFAWALWRGRIRRRGWLAVVALQALLVAGGFTAKVTGERDEDRVESAVPEAALELHEERADQFVWTAAGTLGAALLVLALPTPGAARLVAAATMVGTIAVTAAIRVGHAGGRLVYAHNAGAAWVAERLPVPASRAGDARSQGGRERSAAHGDEREPARDSRAEHKPR